MSDYLGIVILAMLTFGAFIAFALANKAAIANRGDEAPKSTLAADKSSTGKPADV